MTLQHYSEVDVFPGLRTTRSVDPNEMPVRITRIYADQLIPVQETPDILSG